MEGRIRAGGRLTIPKQIRDELGLKMGAKLRFEPQEDGSILIRKLRTRQELEEAASRHVQVKIGPPITFTFRPTPPSGPSPQTT